jgi:hypothetical protein
MDNLFARSSTASAINVWISGADGVMGSSWGGESGEGIERGASSVGLVESVDANEGYTCLSGPCPQPAKASVVNMINEIQRVFTINLLEWARFWHGIIIFTDDICTQIVPSEFLIKFLFFAIILFIPWQ